MANKALRGSSLCYLTSFPTSLLLTHSAPATLASSTLHFPRQEQGLCFFGQLLTFFSHITHLFTFFVTLLDVSFYRQFSHIKYSPSLLSLVPCFTFHFYTYHQSFYIFINLYVYWLSSLTRI